MREESTLGQGPDDLIMASSMAVTENTTANITSTEYYDYEDRQGYVTVDHIVIVLFIIFITLGLVCNSLALVTFAMSKTLSKATTGLYLIALAVADNIFLVGELFKIIFNYFDHDKEYYK